MMSLIFFFLFLTSACFKAVPVCDTSDMLTVFGFNDKLFRTKRIAIDVNTCPKGYKKPRYGNQCRKIITDVSISIVTEGAEVSEQICEEGSTVELRCEITGVDMEGGPALLWYRRDSLLNNDTTREGISVNTEFYKDEAILVHLLQVHRVRADDAGKYTCKYPVTPLEADVLLIVNKVNGTMDKELKTTTGCDGNAECLPKLAMTLKWTIGNDYQLGSSTSESITISVTNNGTSANKVCIKVKPVGMRLVGPDIIYLPTPFTKTSYFQEVLQLDMNSTTNEDKTLQVIVTLYKTCDDINNIHSKVSLRSNVLITGSHINVSKSAENVDVKNMKYSEENIKLIIADHYYNITNLYAVPWNKLKVDLFVKNETYINNIKLHGAETDDCQISDINNTIKYSCIINIKPLKSTKLHITMNVLEDIAKKAMVNGRVKIESKLVLYIDKDIPEKEFVLESEVIFQELKAYQNDDIEILLYSLLGLLLLILLIYALYKYGFFARKQKAIIPELDHLTICHDL